MIPEEELLKLRRVVARFWGEDVAQDTIVLVLEEGLRDNWFGKGVLLAKRQWQRAQGREGRTVEFIEESYPSEDDTNRIIAYIELRERAEANPYFRYLLRVELGFRGLLASKTTLNRYRRKARDETHRKFAPRLVGTSGTCKGDD